MAMGAFSFQVFRFEGRSTYTRGLPAALSRRRYAHRPFRFVYLKIRLIRA
jgi:hypothetical protein